MNAKGRNLLKMKFAQMSANFLDTATRMLLLLIVPLPQTPYSFPPQLLLSPRSGVQHHCRHASDHHLSPTPFPQSPDRILFRLDPFPMNSSLYTAYWAFDTTLNLSGRYAQSFMSIVNQPPPPLIIRDKGLQRVH